MAGQSTSNLYVDPRDRLNLINAYVQKTAGSNPRHQCQMAPRYLFILKIAELAALTRSITVRTLFVSFRLSRLFVCRRTVCQSVRSVSVCIWSRSGLWSRSVIGLLVGLSVSGLTAWHPESTGRVNRLIVLYKKGRIQNCTNA